MVRILALSIATALLAVAQSVLNCDLAELQRLVLADADADTLLPAFRPVFARAMETLPGDSPLRDLDDVLFLPPSDSPPTPTSFLPGSSSRSPLLDLLHHLSARDDDFSTHFAAILLCLTPASELARPTLFSLWRRSASDDFEHLGPLFVRLFQRLPESVFQTRPSCLSEFFTSRLSEFYHRDNLFEPNPIPHRFEFRVWQELVRRSSAADLVEVMRPALDAVRGPSRDYFPALFFGALRRLHPSIGSYAGFRTHFSDNLDSDDPPYRYPCSLFKRFLIALALDQGAIAEFPAELWSPDLSPTAQLTTANDLLDTIFRFAPPPMAVELLRAQMQLSDGHWLRRLIPDEGVLTDDRARLAHLGAMHLQLMSWESLSAFYEDLDPSQARHVAVCVAYSQCDAARVDFLHGLYPDRSNFDMGLPTSLSALLLEHLSAAESMPSLSLRSLIGLIERGCPTLAARCRRLRLLRGTPVLVSLDTDAERLVIVSASGLAEPLDILATMLRAVASWHEERPATTTPVWSAINASAAVQMSAYQERDRCPICLHSVTIPMGDDREPLVPLDDDGCPLEQTDPYPIKLVVFVCGKHLAHEICLSDDHHNLHACPLCCLTESAVSAPA